jgi:diguanylate cyclase (GGDEF)-like protein
VVPIGVIVAVAVVCIAVAGLSSAWRADAITVDHERQMLARSFKDIGAKALREIDSIAATDAALQNLRTKFDSAWAERRFAHWLKFLSDDNYVLVLGGNNALLTAPVARGLDQPDFAPALPKVRAFADYLRGRNSDFADAAVLAPANESGSSARPRLAVATKLLGRPAILSAAAVGPVAEETDGGAPVMVSVRFIDEKFLDELGTQLRLTRLRNLGAANVPADEIGFSLDAGNGGEIVRLAWVPKQPGAEIVHGVLPYIAVALAGFAVLACFVLRYMRRTAVAIAAGESRLRHLAMHDPLCGLPNRIFFGDRLSQTIEEVRDGGPAAAVFYIDLDHFKDVNDTLGHPVGDELIRNVTLRLSHTLRGGDMVARLGGDEFAVISSIGGDHPRMMAMAQRIIDAICAPYSINGQNIAIGASIGIAVIDQFSGDAANIMRHADVALYRAKNEGRNRACMYDAAMDAELCNRKLIESELRTAIENDGLRVLYQPIVNKSGDTLVGVEALCRWTHPERGEIGPAEFIPIAEHSGLIIELGAWVLRRACLDGKAWPGLTVAVNVSPLQFRRADFVDTVERVLAETGFDPARLELELTESVLLGNVDSAEAAMLKIKALGVRLALDDFGTGYSSLLYLRRFPFDKLKIDRSFVLAIEKAADAAAIVHAIVSLGRGLGMKVTAEGVETADQQLFLRAAGVHFMQGYRFGHAMPAADLAARLLSVEPFQPAETAVALTG